VQVRGRGLQLRALEPVQHARAARHPRARAELSRMSPARVLAVLVAMMVTLAFAGPGASAQNSGGGVGYQRALGDRLPLTEGMSGDDVASLQQALTLAGFPVTVDGQFGAATEQALVAWEAASGRPVDGIVDADDAAALLGVLRTATPIPTPAPAPAPLPAPQPTPAPTGTTATINSAGHAIAAAGSPVRVQRIIAAANHIATLPYRFGGGHGRFTDTAYDCSGSVSFALHGAKLLQTTLDSTGLERFGAAGPGRWVTIYANAGHTFMVVEGLRFDTSGATQAGTRWQADERPSKGYVIRHPVGL
jgi:peptidoglycan hydrolase-like protein with peptidoglycan-binding domain